MQKMNNKGFTVVELLASFTLTMLIVVFLFEIVLELKNVYVDSALKTQVINSNALVTSALNNRAEKRGLYNTSCSNTSCTLYYSGATENLTITNNSVKIGSAQTINYPSEVKLEEIVVTSGYNSGATGSQDNKTLTISYKITGDNLKKDIDYNFIYLYRG